MPETQWRIEWRSKLLSFLAVVLFLAPVTLLGQDQREHRSLAPRSTTSSHIGNSPFSPREEDDTRFIVDEGSGLDTGCSYRNDGPLQIHLPVKRFVAPVGPDGTLSDPGDLVSRGLISAEAHIRMPAFDVDVNPPNDLPPEVDRVLFNGHNVGTLTGDNNIWKLNEFVVPIAWVKFPVPGSTGSPLVPVDNLIEIYIDDASVPPEENWCTEIDWVELEFSAIAPIFLVHGTNADSDTWDPHFTAFFRSSGAPGTNDINLAPNGTILGNSVLLGESLRTWASHFGAKKCHIIAHSKGGLDTRAYLNGSYSPDVLKVLSVYTLSTPHHGTIISDIIVAKRSHNDKDPWWTDPDIGYLIDHDYTLLTRFTPQQPAIGDQTTGSMMEFNRKFPSVPNNIRFYSIGADADLNQNGRIESFEALDMFPFFVPLFVATPAANAMYRAIGNVASIAVEVGPFPQDWGIPKRFVRIEVASTNRPIAANDFVTSASSAHSPGGTYLGTLLANHSTMKSFALAESIFGHILTEFPNH